MCETIDLESEVETLGIHHLGLTVQNLEQTLAFFTEVLAYKKVGGVEEYPSAFVSDGHTMLTLWQTNDPERATAFDRRKNIGLHHFALRVKNKTALANIYEKLKERDDVEIEFAPEPLAHGPVEHMMCFIPGGLRMELIALP